MIRRNERLTFCTFSEVNLRRCNQSFHWDIEEWSETDWGCAAAGEMGELCNLLKKRRRGEDIDVEDVGKEIADVVTYLDLLATRMGLDLAAIVAAKFNEVSDRIKSEIKL